MVFLYNIATQLLFFLLRLASPWHAKAEKLIAGQKDLLKRIESALSKDKNDKIWIHAASLGEFEQGRPVIEGLRESFPDHRIVVTFYSPSGYEIRKNTPLADYVFYLPFDSKKNAQAFLKLVNPSLGIIIKYEFWHHYITSAKQMGIPLVSISAIFKPSMSFFQFYGGLFREMLHGFDHIFLQDQPSKVLLESIDVTKVTIAGDTRYDRVVALASHAEKNAVTERFKSNKVLLVAGSTWPSDIDMISEGVMQQSGQVKCIIAPHEISPSGLTKLLTIFPNSILYSKALNENNLNAFSILIIDNIGMLSSLYSYGDIAFVGGGFKGGLHNTLEPATWGIPVLFGKHQKNIKFQEAQELLSRGAAFEVASSEDFAAKFTSLVSDETARKQAGREAKLQVEGNAGATKIILDYLTKLLAR
jgi:3-deoxy-D-manno-octulosonic-acid transferase